ncbi:MAG: tetratricopeptide repeat protein, partial [Phycisphaerae bacterium]
VLAAKIEIENVGLQLAADHLKSAIQIDANFVEAYYLQGVVYQRWQNNQAAHDYYKLAWDKKPNEALYLLALVEMKIALNQQDEARQLLEEKLVYFEQTAAVRAALARLYALAGDHAQAVTFYRAAALLSPEDLTLRQNFAEELYFAGRYSECLPILEELSKNPAAEDRASVRTILGKTYIALHRARDARSIFAEITRDNPNDNLAWLELGRATLQLDDYLQATGVALRVLKTEPRNLDALILLALCQQKQKQWEGARATLAKAHDVAPENPTVLCLMGVTAQSLGQKDQAADYYAEALKRKPSDPWAQELLATARAPASVPNGQ